MRITPAASAGAMGVGNASELLALTPSPAAGRANPFSRSREKKVADEVGRMREAPT